MESNDKNKLSGTLLVNCSGSACRSVIQQSEKMEAVTFVFRVEKKSKAPVVNDHNAASHHKH